MSAILDTNCCTSKPNIYLDFVPNSMFVSWKLQLPQIFPLSAPLCVQFGPSTLTNEAGALQTIYGKVNLLSGNQTFTVTSVKPVSGKKNQMGFK